MKTYTILKGTRIARWEIDPTNIYLHPDHMGEIVTAKKDVTYSDKDLHYTSLRNYTFRLPKRALPFKFVVVWWDYVVVKNA